jgi:hypothetical protein
VVSFFYGGLIVTFFGALIAWQCRDEAMFPARNDSTTSSLPKRPKLNTADTPAKPASAARSSLKKRLFLRFCLMAS